MTAIGESQPSPGSDRLTPPRSLATLFDPRANSLDLLRLILAATVAFVHASAIGFGHQPVLGHTEVGALAVDAFFVLSGFLVARSYLQLGSLGRFGWHRFLRIMPAFWMTLLITAFVVAPVLARLEGRSPLSALIGENPSYQYVLNNSALFMTTWDVAGLPRGTFEPGVVNGALWTLFFEVVCYVLLAVMGLVGVLSSRRWLLPTAIVVVWVAIVLQATGLVEVRGELYLRFFLVFLLGAAAFVFGSRVPITGTLTVLSSVVVAGSLWAFTDYRVLGAPAFAYLCLVAVVRTPWLRRRPRADLSYGVYVLHWPIEVLLASAGATAAGVAGFTALSLLLAAAAATCSWYLVEAPALRHKGDPPPAWLGRLRRRSSDPR